MPHLISTTAPRLASLLALISLVGCYESNALEADAGTEPDGAIYIDGGPPPPPVCDDGTACGSGMQCCPGCAGDFLCMPADEMCLPPPCPPPPRACAALTGAGCEADEYCDYGPVHICGEIGTGDGICMARPTACPDIDMPVCGCDLMEYGNECEARRAGVDVATALACATLPPIPVP